MIRDLYNGNKVIIGNMNILDHLINERPVMLVRYIIYIVIAVTGVVKVVKAKRSKVLSVSYSII